MKFLFQLDSDAGHAHILYVLMLQVLKHFSVICVERWILLFSEWKVIFFDMLILLFLLLTNKEKFITCLYKMSSGCSNPLYSNLVSHIWLVASLVASDSDNFHLIPTLHFNTLYSQKNGI